MQAMILAAGLGTRLRPYSCHRPKPLFPVLDKPLLFHLLAQLRGQGFTRIIVNSHYLREQFVAQLRDESGIYLQLEEEVLGTGGGLRLALPRFKPEPLLVVNGDTLMDLDLLALRERHLQSEARISLVVHEQPRFNNLKVSATGMVEAFRVGPETVSGDREARLLAFTGVHLLDPSVLGDLAPGRFSDIVDHYIRLAARGEKINAIEVSDHFWADMGTPADYLALHGDLLMQRLKPWPAFLPRPVSPLLIGPGSRVENGASLEEWAVVGTGAQIGAGATVRRSVVWDGARVGAGALVEDQIIVA
jgi:mannose-1-phosphate guanylyltransferase